MPDRIRNIQNVGISTISEIIDFVNSINEIIDKEYDYSKVDGIFVELFKKAKLFEIYIEHLKRAESLNSDAEILKQLHLR